MTDSEDNSKNRDIFYLLGDNELVLYGAGRSEEKVLIYI
jgi:hypothetical protein